MGATFTPNPENVEVLQSYVPVPEAGLQQVANGEAARSWETILLVEDEDCIREITRRILEMHGYTVLTAANANEGIRVFDDYDGAINLVVTDIMMPGMNGRELVRRLNERAPGLKTIFISGYDCNVARADSPDPKINYLQKPFTVDELARKIREVIDDAIYPNEECRVN
jgi:two-component system cell cycle sensor histidine kinase/response regulator CckA